MEPESDDWPGVSPVTDEDYDRSLYPLRKRKPISILDQPAKGSTRTGSPERSDSKSAPAPPDTPVPTDRNRQYRQNKRLHVQQTGGDNRGQERQYCTQERLLGLIRKGPLDSRCPNVQSHRKDDSTGVYHPVTYEERLQLLWKQLEWSLDEGITPLVEGGTRSVLFKVTLLIYSYTFVSKGIVRAFVPDLEHEGAVYNRLQSIQGLYYACLPRCYRPTING